MSDGNIQAAKTKLCLAVGRLIDRRQGIYHDATHYAPSLYDCLVSDLPGTQGDNKSPAKSMPPVWIDALQLRGDIDTQTQKWVPRLKDTPNRLGFLKHHSWRPQDTDNVTSIARQVDVWCEKILNLLAPESRKEITAPCPSCGRRTVYRKDPGGENVRMAALVLVVDKGCTCLACEAHWSPEYYLHLSRLLEISPPEGVLE